jgi:hypothetical protein
VSGPQRLGNLLRLADQFRTVGAQLTFRFDPAQGYLPLLTDRPTIVILASGSDFATGMNRGRIDMAKRF